MAAPAPPVEAPPAAPPANPWAIRSLPPFPAVALQLLSLLDDDDVAMKQVVDLLRVDPALSAEILRVSNSALYGLSRTIDSVSHAVVVLGSETVKRLALTVALGRFTKGAATDKGLGVCWNHSVATGLVAEQIAEMLGASKDRAYTAGLLSDVGRLALLTAYPNEYSGMLEVARENDFDELECEQQLFDIDHCGAGAHLARQWNLPTDIIDAIARHHEPPPEEVTPLAIVCAATLIADELGFRVVERDQPPSIADALSNLPLHDPARAVEHFDGYGEIISQAISTVSPR